MYAENQFRIALLFLDFKVTNIYILLLTNYSFIKNCEYLKTEMTENAHPYIGAAAEYVQTNFTKGIKNISKNVNSDSRCV